MVREFKILVDIWGPPDKERISSKFKIFKSRHPTFTYTIEKEESTNMLIIKHLSMYEQIN